MTTEWTSKPVPPSNPETLYEAVEDELRVIVTHRSDSNDVKVNGYLGDVLIWAFSGDGTAAYRDSLKAAKQRGIDMAHRLFAAGVRGSISYSVTCCERTFVTRDAADQHETDHAAAFEADLDVEDHQRESEASEA